MISEFIMSLSTISKQQEIIEIEECNEFTCNYDLFLSYQDALKLAETSMLALKNNGRVQFGDSIATKIITEFYSSPYISKDNYVETINSLIEIFYFYKNETLDLISDEQLIKSMRNSFDGICQGSIDFLVGNELYNFARNLRLEHGENDGNV